MRVVGSVPVNTMVVALVGEAVTLAICVGLPNVPNSSDNWSVKLLPAENEPVVDTVTETGEPGHGVVGETVGVLIVCARLLTRVATLRHTTPIRVR